MTLQLTIMIAKENDVIVDENPFTLKKLLVKRNM